jgi:para-nitrobenzyl esterase
MTMLPMVGGSRCRLLLLASLTLALCGAYGHEAAAAGGHRVSSPLVVQTDKGAVRGMFSGGVREFLGIPYAAPPVGALRWRAPRPAAPWAGVRQATSPGNLCAQFGSPGSGEPNTSTAEDCLYLNVDTPQTSRDRTRGRLPVMVWIHGGGFTGGAGSIYDGRVITAKGNVIVVTINYRLGGFGFLALPSLDKQSPVSLSGNYGLEDQQAALRWVQRNAAVFGGDPHRVTIFGESAGGAAVCDNIASPTATGLFARAIAESGCIGLSSDRTAAEQNGAAFAERLGCDDPATAAACLRGKSASDVLNAAASGRWSPVVGGAVLPVQPAQALASRHYNHVPLLQGTNHDEGRLFAGLQFDARGAPLTAAQYPAVIQARVGAANAPKVLAAYPLSAYPSPDLAYAAVFTDSAFSCPALQADQLAAHSGAYGYEFSDPNPPNDIGLTFSFPLGAAHSTELAYVFQRMVFLDTIPPFTPAQLDLSNQIIGYWTRFAATGDPNRGTGPAAPHWPRYTRRRARIQELVPNATAPEPAASFAAFHHCALWASLAGSQ